VSKIVVYAVGGNALAPPGSSDDGQHALVLAKVMSDVVDLLEAGWSVVLTHGNGPQVGELMAMDGEVSHAMDEWVAATQGMIGHTLSLQLNSILKHRHRPERTAVVLTRVLVDAQDEAFAFPTKPVGPVLSAQEVMERDWDIATTVHGPRRVVASPLPGRILDLDVIQTLVEQRAVVICGGGGGIPVIEHERHYTGVPAVIDKDRLSSLLAVDLQAEALIIFDGCSRCLHKFWRGQSGRASSSQCFGSRITFEFGTIPLRLNGSQNQEYDRCNSSIAEHALDSLSTRRCSICNERRRWNDIVPR